MITVDANIWVAAFDQRDVVHERSVTFLRAVAREGSGLHGPVFVALETACALTRRAGDAAVGAEAYERLRSHPSLVLHSIDDRCLVTAYELGVSQMLRGADALYAAIAKLKKAPLVTWDNELVERAGASTPDTWLRDNG